MIAIPEILKKKNGFLVALLALLCFMGSCGWFYRRLYKLETKQKLTRTSVQALEYGMGLAPCLGRTPVPTELFNLPFADEWVLGVQEVKIEGQMAPYNPSLVKSRTGYDLFFRYDEIGRKRKTGISSQIGVVSLDEKLSVTSTWKKVSVGSDYAEDPRVVALGGELYLFYNRMDETNPKCRFMCVANVDPDSYQTRYTTTLDLNLQWVEKNWTPFVHEDQMFLEYRINPRKVFGLPNPELNELKNVLVPSDLAYLCLPWEKKWGEISGGTPPVLVGDEYLGFFHSWFRDENKIAWYVMGAYTFQASAPFSVTAISCHPILFKGIYEAPMLNTATVGKRVIFPSGCVIDGEKVHVSCGENDSTIKIVTFDKERLLKSLSRLE